MPKEPAAVTLKIISFMPRSASASDLREVAPIAPSESKAPQRREAPHAIKPKSISKAKSLSKNNVVAKIPLVKKPALKVLSKTKSIQKKVIKKASLPAKKSIAPNKPETLRAIEAPKKIEKLKTTRTKEKPKSNFKEPINTTAQLFPHPIIKEVEKKTDDNPVASMEKNNLQAQKQILEIPAKILDYPEPEYPRSSRRKGHEGRVVLSVVILENGDYEKIKVAHSSGYSRLDKAALKALKRASFIPAKKDGMAVSSSKQIAFTFRLTIKKK